jgi:hypothetical protein
MRPDGTVCHVLQCVKTKYRSISFMEVEKGDLMKCLLSSRPHTGSDGLTNCHVCNLIIISPLQSTAGHRPLQLLAICLIFGYSYPAHTCRPAQSSLHLAWGRPKQRLPKCDLHSRTCLLQLLSVLPLIWSAHFHFNVLIRCAMSVTLVFCGITSFRIRSSREPPSIALSLFFIISNLVTKPFSKTWSSRRNMYLRCYCYYFGDRLLISYFKWYLYK